MKKHAILSLLMFGLVGCVGIEQYPTNSYTDENFWNYEDNCMAALYLAYNQYWNADMYFGNNILSDHVYGRQPSLLELDQYGHGTRHHQRRTFLR